MSYKINNLMLELLHFISKVQLYDDYKQNIKGNKYTHLSIGNFGETSSFMLHTFSLKCWIIYVYVTGLWPEITDIINILIRCKFPYQVEFGFICEY